MQPAETLVDVPKAIQTFIEDRTYAKLDDKDALENSKLPDYSQRGQQEWSWRRSIFVTGEGFLPLQRIPLQKMNVADKWAVSVFYTGIGTQVYQLTNTLVGVTNKRQQTTLVSIRSIRKLQETSSGVRDLRLAFHRNVFLFVHFFNAFSWRGICILKVALEVINKISLH